MLVLIIAGLQTALSIWDADAADSRTIEQVVNDYILNLCS